MNLFESLIMVVCAIIFITWIAYLCYTFIQSYKYRTVYKIQKYDLHIVLPNHTTRRNYYINTDDITINYISLPVSNDFKNNANMISLHLDKTKSNESYNLFLRNLMVINKNDLDYHTMVRIADSYSRFCVKPKTLIQVERLTIEFAIYFCNINIAYFLCKRYGVGSSDIVIRQFKDLTDREANKRMTTLVLKLIDDEVLSIMNNRKFKQDDLDMFIYTIVNRLALLYSEDVNIAKTLLEILAAEYKDIVKAFFAENLNEEFIKIKRDLFDTMVVSE